MYTTKLYVSNISILWNLNKKTDYRRFSIRTEQNAQDIFALERND